MKNYNLAKITLFVLAATQLLNVEAYAGSKSKETLLTNDEYILNDPEQQIGEPIIKKITQEEALQLMHEERDYRILYPRLITIPNRPFKPIEDIEFPETNPDGSVKPKSTKPVSQTTLTTATGNGLDPKSKANSVIMVVDKLVALGKQISPLIDLGVPSVSNLPMDAISVVPVVLSKEFLSGEMENWSNPKTQSYEISYKGFGGIIVARFLYSISFQYGGTYQGKGAYLTGVRSFAKRINVQYGYDLNAKSKLVQITNVGTKGQVIAGATIDMEYTVKNFARTRTNVDTFFIRGDGKIERQRN